MNLSLLDNTFRQKLDHCLNQVKLILTSTKSNTVFAADQVPHSYEDKYLLTQQMVNCSGAAIWNTFIALGVSQDSFQQVRDWDQCSSAVSLRLITNESCRFIKELIRDEESPNRIETDTSGSSFLRSKTVTKIVTKITEYVYEYEVSYQLLLVKGVGAGSGDLIPIRSRTMIQQCIVANKTFPFPESSANNYEINISWMLQRLSGEGLEMNFKIDRDELTCFTPSKNEDIEAALKFFKELQQWSKNVRAFFKDHLLTILKAYNRQNSKIDPVLMDGDNIFVPVFPVFQSSKVSLWNTIFSEANIDTTEESTSTESVSLSPQDWALLVSEQNRSLLTKFGELSNHLPAVSSSSLITVAEAELSIAMHHLSGVYSALSQGCLYIENMLRAQLIAAIGKVLTPVDFGNYMNFHYRKILKSCFQPQPFSRAVRRSPTHSPEGTVRIEVNTDNSGLHADNNGGFQPIYTLCRLFASEAVSLMEFPISAAGKVRFSGKRYVHGWMAHSFSGEKLMDARIVASARQFSSFIVLLGTILSPTAFDPKFAFILQNKEEMEIPLVLSTIPTPKEFRDAIESLSPEQQRFAKAYRAMQLQSTLFGICVIQIKPQLEKVLRLPGDSLTKEIGLTQDLMKLFIDYQISSDLLSFDGDESEDVAHKVGVVRDHVAAINDIISGLKKSELEAKAMENQYENGPPPDFVVHTMAMRSNESEAMAVPKRMLREGVAKRSLATAAFSAPMAMDTFVTSSFVSPPAPPALAGAPIASTSADIVSVESRGNAIALSDQYDSLDESSGAAEDLTKLPHHLDTLYEKFDSFNELHSTTISPANSWNKSSRKSLLAQPVITRLGSDEQRRERSAAFDLLDALTRSGAIPIEDAALHVIIAATHSFDKTLMNSIIQKNVNPIERVERSTLIMGSAILNIPASQLVQASHLQRLTDLSPALFC